MMTSGSHGRGGDGRRGHGVSPWYRLPMTTDKSTSSRQIVESVVRALRLLDCFGDGEPELPLAELVRRGGYSKTTTYRLLNTLEYVGWLERTEAGAFRLTIKAFQVGSILVDSLEIRQEAGPLMSALAARWDCTVYLIVPADHDCVCLDRIDSDGQSIRVMTLDVGGTQPYHLGAGPRVLLAFGGDELLEQTLAGGLGPSTPESITDAAALRRDVQTTRERGYTLSLGDMTPGVGAIGAPVFDRRGIAVASISLAGLLDRFTGPDTEAMAEELTDGCRAISARLGHSPGAVDGVTP